MKEALLKTLTALNDCLVGFETKQIFDPFTYNNMTCDISLFKSPHEDQIIPHDSLMFNCFSDKQVCVSRFEYTIGFFQEPRHTDNLITWFEIFGIEIQEILLRFQQLLIEEM